MNLEELLSKVPEKYKRVAEELNQFRYASISFLVMKGFDALSTYLVVSEFGVAGEDNPLYRYFMENYGINEGCIIFNILTVSAGLGVGYLLNKLTKKYPGKFIEKGGNCMLYAVSVGAMVVGAKNFYIYFDYISRWN